MVSDFACFAILKPLNQTSPLLVQGESLPGRNSSLQSLLIPKGVSFPRKAMVVLECLNIVFERVGERSLMRFVYSAEVKTNLFKILQGLDISILARYMSTSVPSFLVDETFEIDYSLQIVEGSGKSFPTNLKYITFSHFYRHLVSLQIVDDDLIRWNQSNFQQQVLALFWATTGEESVRSIYIMHQNIRHFSSLSYFRRLTPSYWGGYYCS